MISTQRALLVYTAVTLRLDVHVYYYCFCELTLVENLLTSSMAPGDLTREASRYLLCTLYSLMTGYLHPRALTILVSWPRENLLQAGLVPRADVTELSCYLMACSALLPPLLFTRFI